MITWMRTADIHDGKIDEAFSWAVKVANYINKKFKGVKVQVFRNVAGPAFQVHWVVNYPSLAIFEDKWRQIQADKGYGDLLKELREQSALVGASIVDSIYESVS